MPSVNLAQKFSKQVDERFHRESQAMLALNNDFEFTGVDTVKVFSIPVVAMNDYDRNASANRYGSAANLTRNVQTLQVTRDRAFTFVIDRADKLQSQMVMDAGRALSRQISEVCIPEFDAYVFSKLKAAAEGTGSTSTTAVTNANAYGELLKAQEQLGNNNVPDKDRVCFCSYGFANLLKQDSAFVKYGDVSQEMLVRGVIGEVDGCKIVKVPSSRLPSGTAFLLTHPCAATAPRQLEDYKTHDNPPGVSGWLVEGRLIYDCFVLDSKSAAVYWHGGMSGMRTMNYVTTGTSSGKSTVTLINPTEKEASGNKWYYDTAATKSALETAAADTAITPANWKELTANGAEITPSSGDQWIRLIEVDSANKPLAMGDAKLHIG
ncbi:MAG: N4-gp56 family major capsid protein [Clostridiales bacterium]|nr:N4-gp56 family major capsid protein [Clostridiales bacterium]